MNDFRRTRLLVAALLCLPPLSAQSTGATSAASNLPRFVAVAATDGKTALLLQDAEKKQPARWLQVGDKFAGFEIRAYDKEQDTVSLVRDQEIFTVALDTAKVQEGKAALIAPRVMGRDEAVEHAGKWLANLEKETKARPFYQPYDATYETRLSEKEKARIAPARQTATARGQRFFAYDVNGVCATASIPNASDLPSLKKLYQNLTADDWSRINDRYLLLTIEGAMAMTRAQEARKREN